MTLEYLEEQKDRYQKRAEYFSAMDFSHLASDFRDMVDLIGQMEEYIKEKENG